METRRVWVSWTKWADRAQLWGCSKESLRGRRRVAQKVAEVDSDVGGPVRILVLSDTTLRSSAPKFVTVFDAYNETKAISHEVTCPSINSSF